MEISSLLHLFLSNLLAASPTSDSQLPTIIQQYLANLLFRGRCLLLKANALRFDRTMSLSAVVNIMLNKDKGIYPQESIEDGQYLMLSQPPEIQVKVFISWSDLWSWKFQISPSGDFQKNIPSCSSFMSNFQFLPHWSHSHPLISSHSTEEFIISRTKYSALVTQNLDTIYSLTYSTPIHIWPHLRHTRWRLLAALHLPFHVKSFWVWYE